MANDATDQRPMPEAPRAPTLLTPGAESVADVRAGARGTSGSMRMLDDLEKIVSPGRATRGRSFGWGGALVVLALLIGIGAWWNGGRDDDAVALAPQGDGGKPSPVGSAVSTPTGAVEAGVTAVAAGAAVTTPVQGPSGDGTTDKGDGVTARIEDATASPLSTGGGDTADGSRPLPAVPDTGITSTPPAAPASAALRSGVVARQTPVDPADRRSRPVTTAAKKSGDAKRGSPPRTTSAKSSSPTRLASAGSKRAGAAAAGVAVGSGGASTADKRDDPDVLLLSALLEHVSRGAGGGLSETDRSALSQRVSRCQAAKGAREARECRRRLCDGYWGKADVCPAAPSDSAKG